MTFGAPWCVACVCKICDVVHNSVLVVHVKYVKMVHDGVLRVFLEYRVSNTYIMSYLYCAFSAKKPYN